MARELPFTKMNALSTAELIHSHSHRPCHRCRKGQWTCYVSKVSLWSRRSGYEPHDSAFCNARCSPCDFPSGLPSSRPLGKYDLSCGRNNEQASQAGRHRECAAKVSESKSNTCVTVRAAKLRGTSWPGGQSRAQTNIDATWKQRVILRFHYNWTFFDFATLGDSSLSRRNFQRLLRDSCIAPHGRGPTSTNGRGQAEQTQAIQAGRATQARGLLPPDKLLGADHSDRT